LYARHEFPNLRLKSGDSKKSYARCVNVHYMIEKILDRKLASYRDIQEFYGMGDIFDLYELAMVISYNEQPD